MNAIPDAMTSDLIREIRLALAENGDSEKAVGMRAYMKSEMPYRGVQTPIRRKLFRAIFRDHPISDQSDWRDAVLDCGGTPSIAKSATPPWSWPEPGSTSTSALSTPCQCSRRW